MTELDKLIEAVGAGGIARHDLDAFIRWRGLDSLTNDCLDAYNGSLDAAKRLHDALLPGWIWNVVDSETTVWPGYPGDPKDYQEGYCEANPARAWLLAILKGAQAKDAAKGDMPGALNDA